MDLSSGLDRRQNIQSILEDCRITHWVALRFKPAASSFLLLVVWPGATSSVLAPSSDALAECETLVLFVASGVEAQ